MTVLPNIAVIRQFIKVHISLLFIISSSSFLSGQVLPAGHEMYNPVQFNTIDQYSGNIPDTDTVSVEGLSAFLSKGSANDIEKARAIYTWITGNITFDTNSYFSGYPADNSGKGVLKSRKGLSSGFSELYKELADKMGLNCVVIHGFVKGFGYTDTGADKLKSYRTNHDWNAINLNGYWFLIRSDLGFGIYRL